MNILAIPHKSMPLPMRYLMWMCMHWKTLRLMSEDCSTRCEKRSILIPSITCKNLPPLSIYPLLIHSLPIYSGDYVYDEEIQILISFKPKFYKALKEMQKERKDVLLASSDSSPLSHEAGWLKFSEEEQRKMLSLKNKDCKLMKKYIMGG